VGTLAEFSLRKSRSISGTLGAAPGVFNRRDETRRSRFLLLGFCSLLRCNKRAAFLLRCSRLCLFLRRLLLRRLWRFVAHMLKLPPLVWQTRALNRPTFGIAPLTFGSQRWSQQRITNWQNQTISSKSGREKLKRRPRRKKRSSASSAPPIHLRPRWRRSNGKNRTKVPEPSGQRVFPLALGRPDRSFREFLSWEPICVRSAN
jgi:hypothetical protein